MSIIDTEHAILVVAKLLKDVDDYNPDVGMGPSYSQFIHQAITLLDILAYDVGDKKIKQIVERWREGH